MKKTLSILAIAATLTGCASVPSPTECKVHKAVNSPTGQVLSVVAIVGGAVNPGGAALALAGSGYQNSKCPSPRYITMEEARKVFEEEMKARESSQ